MKIAVVSLGCPKNQVDADVFTRALIVAGHETVPRMQEAEVIIVNTCGFIEVAQQEAIGAILAACELKKADKKLKVIVTGCLAEHFRQEVAKELPEIDAVVGIGSNCDLPDIVKKVCEDKKEHEVVQEFGPKENLNICGSRVISTPAHYAWLKIAEGCSNRCSYCIIPAIRGPLRSRPMQSVIDEAKWLAQQGVKEIVLVAQDLTAYGNDFGENALAPLIRKLDERLEGTGVKWIRMLYTYPEKIDVNLLKTVKESKLILPYFDVPIQHCDEGILRSMGRKGATDAVYGAIGLIREWLPSATLRTSLIVGYPGESEEQFEQLCNFVRKIKFDRLGCFAYSAQDGTKAAKLQGKIPAEEREKRAEIVMRLQQDIMRENQEKLVGSEMRVLCDEYSEEEGCWLCRSTQDAPEIDANVIMDASENLEQGEFYDVKVTGVSGLDLEAILL